MRIPVPKDGVHRTKSPDGTPSEEYTVKNGKEHGIHRRWHPNGVLAEERRHRNGLLHGVIRQWNNQGVLLGNCKFQNGTGIFREWHENGQVRSECSYFRGMITGRMRFWAEDGLLYGQRFYFDGRPISKRGYLAKCAIISGLPRFRAEKNTNTLGNFMRRLRRAKREQAKLWPSPGQIEKQRWFDANCKAETKESGSKELVSWLATNPKRNRELGELSKSESLKLARKLYRLGAVRVWAARIERDEDGAQYSRKLIIALPNAVTKRGKICELCVDPARPFIGGSAPAIAIGENYMSVSLM